MKIRILGSAFGDLADGRDFCESQGASLGDCFLDSLFSDMDSLALYAGIHRKFSGFHRLLAKRFPYGIYYQFDGAVVMAYRVLALHRNPRKIRSALESAA